MMTHLTLPASLRAVAVLACALSLSGCIGRDIESEPGDAPNLKTYVANIRARPAPALDPLPVMQQFESFEYSAQNLRDPFSTAFASSAAAAGKRPNPDRRKQLLEQFPLDSLDMVGTIGAGGNLVALVLAPDKVTYKVRPGDYIGQNDGRVSRIDEYRVELVELVPDGSGGWEERAATLTLEDE